MLRLSELIASGDGRWMMAAVAAAGIQVVFWAATPIDPGGVPTELVCLRREVDLQRRR